MDISPSVWWIAAGILVAAELATGTFYLLMVAVGLLVGAVSAHMGMSLTAQLISASVIGGGAVAGWHIYRIRRPAEPPAGANRDATLDVGERVRVAEWDSYGATSVRYRGATWQARYAGEGTPEPGEFVIHAVDGNRLLLKRPDRA